jgi:methyl coenzyme M reductase subunit C
VQSVRVVTGALGSRKEGSTPQQAMNIALDPHIVTAVAQAVASEQNKLLTEEIARLKTQLASYEQQRQLAASLSASTAPSARAARSARRSSAPEATQMETEADAGAQAGPATEPPRARAASAPPRVRGDSAADKAALAAVKRGQTVVVKPSAGYRGYTFEDVCEIGQRIKDGTLTVHGLNACDENGQPKYKVPRSTMRRWIKTDHGGMPRWQVERDCRRRNSLPKSGGTAGGSTVLGDVTEKKLMVEIAQAAKAHCPMSHEEIQELVRETAIQAGLVVSKTGNPYDRMTDVSTLLAGFFRRCAEAGVHFIQKNGRKLGMQRHINQNREALKRYAEIVNPALIEFQETHGVKLGLLDVGNFDETGLDLCAFAETGLFIVLKSSSQHPCSRASSGGELRRCFTARGWPTEGTHHLAHGSCAQGEEQHRWRSAWGGDGSADLAT